MTLPLTKMPGQRSHIILRAWRASANGPKRLYTYAGCADAAMLRAVMATVRDLVEAMPGGWFVDVLPVDVGFGLVQALRTDLHDLRQFGVQPLVRPAPAPPPRRQRRAAAVVAPPVPR